MELLRGCDTHKLFGYLFLVSVKPNFPLAAISFVKFFLLASFHFLVKLILFHIKIIFIPSTRRTLHQGIEFFFSFFRQHNHVLPNYKYLPISCGPAARAGTSLWDRRLRFP